MQPPSFLRIKEYNPVQKQALQTRFLENRANIVVSSPTGSGKTAIAMLAAYEAVKQGKKAVLTCPLKALATEHLNTFKSLPCRVAMSIGDMDSSDKWLENYDIIITSYEKLDSLIRHQAKFLPSVGALICDEVHLLNTDRGASLETIMTRFKHLFPKVQLVALSATIQNAKEISSWLDAELVESDWRPTKLEQGIYYNNTLQTTERTLPIPSEEKTLTQQFVSAELKQNKNLLVFCNTRKSAEATAERLKKFTRPTKTLKKLSHDVEHALESPTRQCKRLAACIEYGVAFHHAGLVAKQRTLIEDAFRNNVIRAITCTPTLALGVNTPADTVVMQTLKRYTMNGLEDIPVSEYLQCSGRAGRPNYNKNGLSVIISSTEAEKERNWEKFVLGKPEPVHSQLGLEPVLRTQILASIALGFTPTRERLREFLLHSFHAFQYGEIDSLVAKCDLILDDLVGMDFIRFSGQRLEATRLGHRTSELYLDPFSAYKLVKAVKEDRNDFALLFALVDTDEMHPWLRAKAGEESELWLTADRLEFEPNPDDYRFLDKLKTTLLFDEWSQEKTEDNILDDYGVAPGILRSKLFNADWIAYSASELARIAGAKKTLPNILRLRRRLRYGVKAELLPLVELKNVGRVRARRLFNAGLTTIKHLKQSPAEEIAQVVGSSVAASVKSQLGEKTTLVSRQQSALSDF